MMKKKLECDYILRLEFQHFPTYNKASVARALKDTIYKDAMWLAALLESEMRQMFHWFEKQNIKSCAIHCSGESIVILDVTDLGSQLNLKS